MQNENASRRRFLRRVAAGGAAGAVALSQASLATPSPATRNQSAKTAPTQLARRTLGATERIRCGCIGVGNRGSSLLHSILKRDDVDVVAITDTYDVWRNRALGWAREKQENVGDYVRYTEMLEKCELDAVVIATPDHSHAPAILAALKAGKDVYVEKPMTLTVKEAQQVKEKVEETGAVLQVGTQLRSMPLYQRVRDLTQAGDLGQLTLVQVNRHYDAAPLDPAKSPAEANEKNVHWKHFLSGAKKCAYDPLRYFHWRQFKEYSNGYFGDLMLHHLDACHFITGCAMPRRMTALGGIYALNDGRSLPDTVSALLEYPEKFQFNYTTTVTNGHYGLVERYLFTQGAIEIRDMASMSIYRNGAEEKVASEGPQNDAHLKDFFDRMRDRKPTIAPVSAGYVGAVCTRLALHCAQKGRSAQWDEKEQALRIPE